MSWIKSLKCAMRGHRWIPGGWRGAPTERFISLMYYCSECGRRTKIQITEEQFYPIYRHDVEYPMPEPRAALIDTERKAA